MKNWRQFSYYNKKPERAKSKRGIKMRETLNFIKSDASK